MSGKALAAGFCRRIAPRLAVLVYQDRLLARLDSDYDPLPIRVNVEIAAVLLAILSAFSILHRNGN